MGRVLHVEVDIWIWPVAGPTMIGGRTDFCLSEARPRRDRVAGAGVSYCGV